MSVSGLIRVDGVVVLSGPALRATLQGVLEGIKWRRSKGLPFDTQEALACELLAAMAVGGQTDVRSTPFREPMVTQPDVPTDQVAKRLGVSPRQARRIAARLGGRKVGRQWLVDEHALRQHIEGQQQ